MRRFIAMLLIAALLAGAALAEGADAVSTYVSRQGYKAVSVKNRTKLTGCWYTADDAGETLQWSDKERTYTVSAKSGGGLLRLYGELIGMAEWDACSLTAEGKVQFAFNAPESGALRSYKTLKNYVKYVTEYIDQNTARPAEQSSGKQSFVLNKESKKFHRPDCASARQISKENRGTFKGTREELLKMGYEPCKNCNP